MDIKIITPERTVLEDEADSAILPGADGLLGVLPGHTPATVMLKKGVIKLTGTKETELIEISGGYAEIEHKGIVVLTETAAIKE